MIDSKYLSDIARGGERREHCKYAFEARGVIVEIGVLHGSTTRLLLEHSSVPVYGIDPIIPDSMNKKVIGDMALINSIKLTYSRFIFIKDYSYNVVKTWTRDIGYLFIDGDHKYKAVKRDFNDWFPHVSQGGVISIHDSAASRAGPKWWPGPSKFVDEILYDKRLEYIKTVQSMTIFKKL